jgi:hypothetical protein
MGKMIRSLGITILLLVLGLGSAFEASALDWMQFGADIDGEAADNFSGESVFYQGPAQPILPGSA